MNTLILTRMKWGFLTPYLKPVPFRLNPPLWLSLGPPLGNLASFLACVGERPEKKNTSPPSPSAPRPLAPDTVFGFEFPFSKAVSRRSGARWRVPPTSPLSQAEVTKVSLSPSLTLSLSLLFSLSLSTSALSNLIN